MTRKDIKRTIGRISLAILEYIIKSCAFVAALVTIGSSGSVMEKVASGFGSLPVVFQKIPSAIQQMSEMAAVVQDYNTKTMATFANSHGYDAISSLMLGLNDVVLYFTAINQNFSEASLSTLAATAIVFFGFFFVSLILRIARRKGKDLFWARLEKGVWNRFFETDQPSENTGKVSSRTSQQREHEVTRKEENEDPEPEEEWTDPTVFQHEEEVDEEKPTKPEHALKLVEKPEHGEEVVENFNEAPQNGHVQEYSDFEDSDKENTEDESESTNLMSALDMDGDEETETATESESSIDLEVEDAMNTDSEEEKRESINRDNSSSSLEKDLAGELSKAKDEEENANGTEEEKNKLQNNSLNEFLEMARSSSG